MIGSESERTRDIDGCCEDTTNNIFHCQEKKKKSFPPIGKKRKEKRYSPKKYAVNEPALSITTVRFNNNQSTTNRCWKKL
jgi:hypothetical protein